MFCRIPDLPLKIKLKLMISDFRLNPSINQSAILNPLNIKNKSMSVFEGSRYYINSCRMYYAYHESFPNMTILWQVKDDLIVQYIESKLHDRIIRKHYCGRSEIKKRKSPYINIIYVMHDELMIEVDDNGTAVILFSDKSVVAAKEIETELSKLKKTSKHGRDINLVAETRNGLDLIPVNIKKPKLDLSLNYNDNLKELHDYLTKILNKKNKSGLVLFHGTPGTGKSTYIRLLIQGIKKTVIFLPPKVAGILDSPGMTTLLVENPNSIFIIEDAEELIKSREGKDDSNISMLLNLTDGMLGESLGV